MGIEYLGSLISKDTFIGIMMSGNPHVGYQKQGKYVEAFWLIPVQGRAEIFDAFAKHHGLRFGSPVKYNEGIEYIRIQNRKTLNTLMGMIPPCLIDVNQRVKYFFEVMRIINSKEHLTQEGRDKIELLKQKMHKWYTGKRRQKVWKQ